ncbi:hypothetical protein KSF78_0002821 [Schistosoma japonicum]|nr:hypothetical protein KSF78_0002821 [Schistosoma japonicum]
MLVLLIPIIHGNLCELRILMSYLNTKNPTVSRYFESNNDKSRSRSNSPQHTVGSRTSSTFIPDNRSISSTKSVKSYPRKGTTLASANLTTEERKHLEEVLARFDQFRQIEDSRVNRWCLPNT